MIVIVHHQYKIVSCTLNSEIYSDFIGLNLSFSILKIAAKFPSEIIVWIDKTVVNDVNLSTIPTLLNTDQKLISYQPTNNFFSKRIGYIEELNFINVNKKVSYATWQMSSCIGAIHAKTLVQIPSHFFKDKNFNFVLNSIAKQHITLGLFCYSEPKLLNKNINFINKSANNFQLFKFVKQNYKWVWTLLLFFNIFIYEKKIILFPFLNSLFYKRKQSIALQFSEFDTIDCKNETVDVIIPTIGRSKYLHNVLNDLKTQTLLPKKVIIVEQNAAENSKTELDFVLNEDWPFAIDHIFTHQLGACNARNIALSKVSSKWIFLNEDDNELTNYVIEKSIENCLKYNIEAVVNYCPQPNEIKQVFNIHQTNIFSSGSSFIKAEVLNKVSFDMNYEFCYGEDFDFGMQLRQNGYDVLYFPNPAITHLKAPMGGFRTKFVFPWDNETIAPKPSPTIMLNRIKYFTKEQNLGYKTILFLKLLKNIKLTQKLFFIIKFNKQWNVSVLWANKLNNNND